MQLWSVVAALRGDADACLATLVPGSGGRAAYTPDGRYKLGGDAPGLLGFTVGLCRFEAAELDDYPESSIGLVGESPRTRRCSPLPHEAPDA